MPSLLATLEKQAAEKKDAVARGLLSAMTCYNFVATIYLLSDVLPGLTALSLVFQTEDVDISLIQPHVSATISALKLLRDQNGSCMQKLSGVVRELSTQWQFSIPVTEQLKTSFQTNICEKYIDSLVDNLEERFRDACLLKSLSTLFDPKSAVAVLLKTPDQFTRYGEEQLTAIAEHFQASVTKERLLG